MSFHKGLQTPKRGNHNTLIKGQPIQQSKWQTLIRTDNTTVKMTNNDQDRRYNSQNDKQWSGQTIQQSKWQTMIRTDDKTVKMTNNDQDRRYNSQNDQQWSGETIQWCTKYNTEN